VRSIATTFAREGAKVTITGRRKEILGGIADAIAAVGGRSAVLAVPGSVTEEADVQHAVQATLATFGRIDVLSRAVIPHMQRQGGGSIVNIGSVLGLKASLAFPAHPYAVAKAGVAMLTKTIAVHYAKDGIRCNCGAPAVTETPLMESRLKDPAARTAMEARVPLGRLGRPDGVAQAVLYFASDDAAWATGTVLTVDGGIMAQ